MKRYLQNTTTIRSTIYWSILAAWLVAGPLLLSACTVNASTMTVLADTVSARPAPSLQPARFADFDVRADVPDRIEIPAIGLETPVVELGWQTAQDPAGRLFKNWDVAAYAAGWHVAQRFVDGNVRVLSQRWNLVGG